MLDCNFAIWVSEDSAERPKSGINVGWVGFANGVVKCVVGDTKDCDIFEGVSVLGVVLVSPSPGVIGVVTDLEFERTIPEL